jgi:ABC-type nitrate/sulfonate/bicarbonate transport system substrate-binding protein
MTITAGLRMGRRLLLAVALALAATRDGSAEPIKIGLIKIAASGPIYVAKERGYFAAEDSIPSWSFSRSAFPSRSASSRAISILARRR